MWGFSSAFLLIICALVDSCLFVQVRKAHVLVTHGNRWFIARVLLQKVIIYERVLEQVHDIQ